MSGYIRNRQRVWIMRILTGVLAAVFFYNVFCDAGEISAIEYSEIYTYEDLLMMADNPDGNYILMQDIDMNGREWKPIDFSGSFDGNGYALINVTVTELSDSIMQTYDGNMKVYDTYLAGFFGVLSNASVSNLNLINYHAQVTAEQPCFVGSIAGYSENSTITGCNINAYIRLDAHDRMFGVGGIVGYGNGRIEGTDATVQLICNDTDSANRDEQFLGGAYGAGYFDLDNCHIDIDGYVSEHGYAHNGGVAGLYILYPSGTVYEGYLTNTRVTGKISFYEDNTDRRAYCKDFIGEVMNWTYQVAGNSSDFVRDESYDYSVVLLPHTCAEPVYTEEIIAADCENYGYELYHCQICGYEYRDNYIAREHIVEGWRIVKEASVDDYGVEEGECTLCGKSVRRITEKLEEPETTETISQSETESTELITEASTTQPENEIPNEAVNETKTVNGIAVAALCIVVFVIIITVLIKGKRR
ncbi:MAG: hypothetical protein ACI4R6_02380 [Lachnospiraceae bacterium]